MLFQVAAYGFLGLAIVIAAVHRGPWLPLGVFFAACVAALISGNLAWTGAALVGVVGATSYMLYQRAPGTWLSGSLIVVLLASGIAILLHLAPGFHNLKLLSGSRTSADAAPYSLYLNFDKASLGFWLLLFAAGSAPSIYEWGRIAKLSLVYFVPAAVVLIGTTYLAGLVAFDPKLVSFLPVWLFANLLFVSAAEELFFRQFILGWLLKWFGRNGLGGACALILSSILFAAFHLPGGVFFAGFAGLAGLFYGLAFWKSGRVEVAILVHFLVNLTHILFFTYPYIARVS
ncbi:CPBP family intramembrane glutamic endopeptidase [Roseibium sp. RKSG952]|uniref:CPBP family intramembrane glutamic endopeptidase n=1 Tax=Roseibium sp. RKSG952 TaxID=2529384 RepID=UPI0012BD2E2D|nr:CPBP family intramembrane glutamic endopeptidase [Roseibium sp. RKSG952]MTI01069.1 CPBP family intramembrane metalloprotease [Roseibium sp. RKSG952]